MVHVGYVRCDLLVIVIMLRQVEGARVRCIRRRRGSVEIVHVEPLIAVRIGSGRIARCLLLLEV